MNGRGQVAAAVAAVLLLGATACTADGPAKAGPAPPPLRAGLLTADLLPEGFTLNTSEVESTTTRAPGAASTYVPNTGPLESMPCSELGIDSFLTTHAKPLEDVAVGLERRPVGDDDFGWGGQEVLDRYPFGRAAAVLDAVRAAVGRCADFSTVLEDGAVLQESATATQVGDSLRVRITSMPPPEGVHPWVDETAFVRFGDVVLTVQQIGTDRPTDDLRTALDAAVRAYRARAH
ncbi:hypothetical protein K353_02280 [Kitasatospora sp. SolWspMP-SS2h]|uniref:hypothetical protein n=1 Tax=Kitasatospora sp. SolWspMP-SS2h TaxID=1305729 RepID=UPI000DBA7ECA|nr:hypothetical protein [Kitasatospora sp. SolWspMP-SS2h]RAJ42608.1 hypothetical protein K353_02280 [Kitasatospora sp. SolWspMP-SS2h]